MIVGGAHHIVWSTCTPPSINFYATRHSFGPPGLHLFGTAHFSGTHWECNLSRSNNSGNTRMQKKVQKMKIACNFLLDLPRMCMFLLRELRNIWPPPGSTFQYATFSIVQHSANHFYEKKNTFTWANFLKGHQTQKEKMTYQKQAWCNLAQWHGRFVQFRTHFIVQLKSSSPIQSP